MKQVKLFLFFALASLLSIEQMWAEPKVVFHETFDQCNGTGGNDGKWNGSVASANFIADNAGWTYDKAYGAKQCAKFGTSGAAGIVETPAISVGTTAATLTFKAAAWDANSDKTTLLLTFTSCEGDQASVEMAKGEWTSFTVALSGITDAINIKFEGNKRFFLDEVVVTEVDDTPGPEPIVGQFSISATQQVEFAPGNLQFHMKDSVWRFAPNQYEWLGNANLEMGNPDYDGWVDLLSWSIGPENNYGATSNYDTMTYVNKSFVDYGNLFESEKWFTMSRDQWNYLLNKRANANDKWGMALIGDTLGMILLPDEWTAPEGITFVPGTLPLSELWRDEDALDDTGDHYRIQRENMPANLFTIAQWEELEAAGAAFLPYAGRRSGGFGNYLNTKCQTVTEMFRYSYYENYLGTYWTSTLHNAAKGQADYIYTFSFDGEYHWGKAVIWSENGRYGQSVRLVRLANDEPTDIDQITNHKSQITNKFIRDGQLLIERNGELFTITGQPIR